MNYTLHQNIESEKPCKICATNELKVIATKGRNFQNLTTVICKGCGLIHSYPIPTQVELDEDYKKQYRSDYKSAYSPQRKHILRYSRCSTFRVNQLLKFSSKGQKLLDVGSGSGEFVYTASLAGFETYGLEPHEGYSEYTRKTFGIPIITAPLEKADIAPETFDIITLNHVLEHLHLPLTSLSYLNRWLKIGGILAIEVPDIENTQHSPMNRFHFAHIYNFNHVTLKAILEKSGFTLDENSETKGTTLLARKTGLPTPEKIISMPQNYHHLLHLMSKEVALENYRKKKPIKRIFSKIHRYSSEWIEAFLLRDPKKILLREFKKSNKRNMKS